jgi:electron transport complex protein RnfC
MPLVKKCITLDGGAIASPKNVIAPIGASIKEIIELSSGFKCEPAKILLGGPMMGNAVNTVDFPIMKNTNAVLAFNEAEAAPKPETACIKCGTCASRCPYHLNPAAFLRAYNRGDMEELIRLRIDICMECGCCSYSCPAAKPLVETNKLSKAAVREYSEKKRKSESEKKEEKR